METTFSGTGGGESESGVTGVAGANGQFRRPTKAEEDLDRKVFIGGISWDTTEADLYEYFGKFGEVCNVNIKYDQATGRSRGFGFIEFGSVEATNEVIRAKLHEIKGKQCEVKRAMSRENKKVFVGGISNDFPADQLKEYFSKYGEVEEVELPVDKTTNRRRNFVFVVFKDETGANRAIEQTKHLLGDRYCDVKMFQPDARKPPGLATAGGPGGYPGAYGGAPPYAGGAQGQMGPYGDYNQYWQQYWQYYYGQYYSQYGAAGAGGASGMPAGYPGYGQQPQSGSDATAQQQAWSQYAYDYARNQAGQQQ